ncbi:MAG: hypothetical protein ACLQKK_16205 [Rhodomicrobium sp.]
MMLVGMRADRQWTLGFLRPAWKFTPGETIPIGLTFDGREQFNVFGEAQTIPGFVVVLMPQNSALLNQFRKANGMTAFTKGNAFTLALTSTSQLMPVLAHCVDRMNRGGMRAAGDFSIATAAPPAPQPTPAPQAAIAPEIQAWGAKNPWINYAPQYIKEESVQIMSELEAKEPDIPVTEKLDMVTEMIRARHPELFPPQLAPVTVPSSLKPGLSQDYQIEAMEIATNFILKSALQSPRILSRSEIPATLASNGAAWKSEEAYGFVRIVAQEGDTKGIDIASAIAAADSKECKGKFASGRVAELVDSDVVFRGFAACEDTDGARSAQYFVIPRKKGGFVVFSVVSDMKTDLSKNVVKDEKLVDFRKAALVAVAAHQ